MKILGIPCHTLKMAAINFVNLAAFYMSGTAAANKKFLKTLKDKYKGKRCFIVCNGPSLRPEDLTKIHESGDISIAMNMIGRVYKDTPWRATFLAVCFAQGRVGPGAAPVQVGRVGFLGGGEDGEGRGGLPGPGGDVVGNVLLHLNHLIRDVEVGAGAARHDDGGDPEVLIEAAHPLDKGRDGLLRGGDHLLHELVTNHKVGGRGVLVDEEQAAAALDGLHQVSGLGGASAGVLRGEMPGVLFVGQMADKR